MTREMTLDVWIIINCGHLISVWVSGHWHLDSDSEFSGIRGFRLGFRLLLVPGMHRERALLQFCVSCDQIICEARVRLRLVLGGEVVGEVGLQIWCRIAVTRRRRARIRPCLQKPRVLPRNLNCHFLTRSTSQNSRRRWWHWLRNPNRHLKFRL